MQNLMSELISEDRFKNLVSSFNKLAPILVAGDIGIDKYTHGDVTRISPEAPVPVLNVKKEWMKLGLAANVSDNLKALDIESTLCGICGDDRNANELETLLEENKLKTWGIIRDGSRMTTYKERVTTSIQQICRVDYESKEPMSDSLEEKLYTRLEDFYEGHSAVIVEDYGKGFFNENIAQALIKRFQKMGKIVAVDPSRYSPVQWYNGATLLKPNFAEAQAMAAQLGYRGSSVEVIAELLIEKLEVEKLIITLGSEGMALIDTKDDNRIHYIPTVANEVFDVSGAGDTAISTITASLVAGASLQEACWIGNCASGVVVGKKGTALVNREELASFYQILKQKFI
jgi:rfaE bifunctional protein kinase chain/domain